MLQDFRDESHPNDKKLKVHDLLFTVKDSFFMLKHCLFEWGHMMVRGWGGWFNGRWSFSHGGWQNVRGWRLDIQGPTFFIHSCMITVSRWLIFLRDHAFYIHHHGLFIQAYYLFVCIWCILISCRCKKQHSHLASTYYKECCTSCSLHRIAYNELVDGIEDIY